jgi:hypothetical protein
VTAKFLKQFLSVRWLCKLFDKALVEALARGALAMCLQIVSITNIQYSQ